MFSLTIVFGPSATSWRLLFKSKDGAEKAMATLNTMPTTHEFAPKQKLEFFDDFGQQAMLNAASIHGWMLENMDESKVGAVEYGLHNARTQASYTQRVQADPTMRAAAASSAHPPILSPMSNGRLS